MHIRSKNARIAQCKTLIDSVPSRYERVDISDSITQQRARVNHNPERLATAHQRNDVAAHARRRDRPARLAQHAGTHDEFKMWHAVVLEYPCTAHVDELGRAYCREQNSLSRKVREHYCSRDHVDSRRRVGPV